MLLRGNADQQEESKREREKERDAFFFYASIGEETINKHLVITFDDDIFHSELCPLKISLTSPSLFLLEENNTNDNTTHRNR